MENKIIIPPKTCILITRLNYGQLFNLTDLILTVGYYLASNTIFSKCPDDYEVILFEDIFPKEESLHELVVRFMCALISSALPHQTYDVNTIENIYNDAVSFAKQSLKAKQ